jgi:hypothetical protein
MIVRYVDNHVLLITQPDHARLARAIMERAPSLADHPRRDAILLAVAAHDDGWAEEDAAPDVHRETGAVVDFVSTPVSVRQATSVLGVTRLEKHPWAAALVAHHRLVVYERFAGNREWTAFFAEMAAARAAALDAAGLPLSALVTDYPLVRLGDLVSLAFCTGWNGEQRFEAWNVRLSGTRVLVTPDLFRGSIIPVAIAVKSLHNRRYRDSADLREAIASAGTTTLRGDVTSASP